MGSLSPGASATGATWVPSLLSPTEVFSSVGNCAGLVPMKSDTLIRAFPPRWKKRNKTLFCFKVMAVEAQVAESGSSSANSSLCHSWVLLSHGMWAGTEAHGEAGSQRTTTWAPACTKQHCYMEHMLAHVSTPVAPIRDAPEACGQQGALHRPLAAAGRAGARQAALAVAQATVTRNLPSTELPVTILALLPWVRPEWDNSFLI